MGGLEKHTKSCEQCDKLGNPDNFPKGVRARIKGVYDCEDCEVMKSQPIPENENAVALFEALPKVYDGMSGLQNITASDIKFVFEVWDVPEELYFDYYQKIVFLHLETIRAKLKAQEKKTKNEEATREWKKRVKNN